MARIRQDDIDAVKERTDIVQLVGTYLTLKKTGHDSLSGLCPFHQEKTASFSVSPSKQVFYCFGCGKGGDAITFLRELEHLSYVEAIERLAQAAGVRLRYEGDSPAEQRAAARRAALYRANEEAAALYRAMLADGREADDARAYVTERGITPESIEGFGIGYAPGIPTSCCAGSSARAGSRRRSSSRPASRPGATTERFGTASEAGSRSPSRISRDATSGSGPGSSRATRARANRPSTSTPPRRRSTGSRRSSTTCTARVPRSRDPAKRSSSRATPT